VSTKKLTLKLRGKYRQTAMQLIEILKFEITTAFKTTNAAVFVP
jgi:hypothetical protein